MFFFDREAQEMLHIGTMIGQLERLIESNPGQPTSAVMTPAYWRTRINAVLAVAPPHGVAAQASALLKRLDRLPSSGPSTVGGSRRS